MKHAKPQPIYLTDYKKPDYLIPEIKLYFDIYERSTRVRSRLRLQRREGVSESTPLILNGEHLKLVSVRLDGKDLQEGDYRVTDKSLTLTGLPSEFLLEIENEIEPHKNTALEGLYKSGHVFCTQNEPEGFRKITYFPDRPDIMSRYHTTLTAEKERYPILLSNGNEKERGDLEKGRHFVIWEDPFPKPCYLFALVAGDLREIKDTFRTRSGRDIALKLFVDKGNEDRTQHAMNSLKKAMKWDEETFGLECDLDTYMIVAVDDFNQGAMENKGLNIFNSQSILANPRTATDDDFEWIQAVVGHEYFHNWTGNRVTCRDWFQLSLKEGLTVFRDQEFTADMTSRTVKRIRDTRNLQNFQFPEDAGPNAHPVRPRSYIKIDNFYTPTVYEKGAEVIRMIQTLIGKQAFRKGIEKYFELYDGQAVTTDDFVNAMELASGRDLGQFKNWYSQAGTPVCKVAMEHDSNFQTLKLTVEQSCRPTPETSEKKPFTFPFSIGFLNEEGRELQGIPEILTVAQPKETFIFKQVAHKPVPSLLRHFSAPVKVEYPYTFEELKFLLAHDTDLFNRYEAGQRLALMSIRQLIEQSQQGRTLAVDSEVLNCFGKILKESELDPAYRAEMLILPSLDMIVEEMAVCDYETAFVAKEFLIRSFAASFEPELSDVYKRLHPESDGSLEGKSIGKRAFKNVCLAYLTTLEKEDFLNLTFRQLEKATMMTDEISALRLLCHTHSTLQEEAVSLFYNRWHGDPLVMNKWFAAQAGSKREDTLNRIQNLEMNSAFDMRNPNKIRALYGVFTHNGARFHQGSGEGYRFIADKILSIDQFNPSMAARLSTAYHQFIRLDNGRRNLMKQELERILGFKNLSVGVYEIISKTLGA